MNDINPLDQTCFGILVIVFVVSNFPSLEMF